MMKHTLAILIVFGAVWSASAVRTTNSVSGTVDTRDYTVTFITPHGDIEPTSGTTITRSWHSLVSSFVYETPVFEQSGTVLRMCSGFEGEGTDPASGSGESAVVKLTNVTSTLTWLWDSSYWVTWSVSGQGAVSAGHPASGGWYNGGQSYLLRAQPETGWLFTGWSGGASGGPSASNLNFTATAPTNLLASFSDDPDGDGLKNTNEWAVGANPWMADTDGDDFDDLFEFNNGLSPTVDSKPFVAHIQNNPDAYGLYTSNAVLDVAVGQVALNIEGTTARLQLQVEQSDDLVSWTNAGDVLEWTLPVGDEKKFLRVRSGAGE